MNEGNILTTKKSVNLFSWGDLAWSACAPGVARQTNTASTMQLHGIWRHMAGKSSLAHFG